MTSVASGCSAAPRTACSASRSIGGIFAAGFRLTAGASRRMSWTKLRFPAASRKLAFSSAASSSRRASTVLAGMRPSVKADHAGVVIAPGSRKRRRAREARRRDSQLVWYSRRTLTPPCSDDPKNAFHCIDEALRAHHDGVVQHLLLKIERDILEDELQPAGGELIDADEATADGEAERRVLRIVRDQRLVRAEAHAAPERTPARAGRSLRPNSRKTHIWTEDSWSEGACSPSDRDGPSQPELGSASPRVWPTVGAPGGRGD